MKLFDVLKILRLKVKRRSKKNPAFLKLKIEAESLYIFTTINQLFQTLTFIQIISKKSLNHISLSLSGPKHRKQNENFPEVYSGVLDGSFL